MACSPSPPPTHKAARASLLRVMPLPSARASALGLLPARPLHMEAAKHFTALPGDAGGGSRS
eukprot:10324331-Lingulodinium_polyedra.AAC.1